MAIIQNDVITNNLYQDIVDSCILENEDIIHPNRVGDVELAHTLAISENNRRILEADYNRDVNSILTELESVVGNYRRDLLFGLLASGIAGGLVAACSLWWVS